MTRIQNSFYNLQQELVDALIDESLYKLNKKTNSKAQSAVDILIRNLYERTADVEFIATDDDICSFVSQSNRTNEMCEKIEKGLGEYVAKYSVYDEIIIFDTNFNILVNFNKQHASYGLKLNKIILEDTLNTQENFIEYFEQTAFESSKETFHVFSSKIYNKGNLVGVICLFFKFENEMQQIFKQLSIDYDGSVILIIDKNNKVIASSDNNHVPVGITIENQPEGINNIVYYKGLEYISKTVNTKGYQGYFGLGWKGHVMIPLSLAFKEKVENSLDNINKEILNGLMKKADSFSYKLKNIVDKTQSINNSLKQIVFNGQIMDKNIDIREEYIKLKPILASIGNIGNNTGHLFDQSIKNLFATLTSTSIRNVSNLASLCIDIMDRNLYERANDCRWWALNSTFKAILAQPNINEQNQIKLTKILEYINSLYTVYKNLFLFDKDGVIVAVSNPNHNNDIGKVLKDEYIINILDNEHAENYFVSSWGKSEFYDDKYTYIYGASITDINNNKKTVGGIGIIFDSEYQFKTMLDDALGDKEGSFAVFADARGQIISSTNKQLCVGDKLVLPINMFEIKNHTYSEIIVFKDSYYAVGCAKSLGYREYKTSDNYKNDVFAFVFEKLADYDKKDYEIYINDTHIEQSDFKLSDVEDHVRLITFKINNQMFSFLQSAVIEAMETDNIISLPVEKGIVKSAVLYNKKYIGVIDLNDLFGKQAENLDYSHLIILKISNEIFIALKVEQLGNILEVNQSDIKTLNGTNENFSIVKGVLSKSDENGKSILILNHQSLINRLNANDFDNSDTICTDFLKINT